MLLFWSARRVHAAKRAMLALLPRAAVAALGAYYDYTKRKTVALPLVVRVLLAAGADPDLKQDNEYRENYILESGVPLILSIAAGHLAIAHLLLDHGA